MPDQREYHYSHRGQTTTLSSVDTNTRKSFREVIFAIPQSEQNIKVNHNRFAHALHSTRRREIENFA